MQNQFIFNPEAGAPPDEGELTDYSPETIRRLQQALNRKAGAALPVDGRMGFRTRRALRHFQQRQGLPAGGLLTPPTISALDLDRPSNSEDETALAFEAAACPPFKPVAIEQPGGGRVRDKKIPSRADLVVIQGAYGKTPLLRQTAEALKALVCAARADGIRHPQLLPTGARSGFRDPQLQKQAWERALRKYGSAKEAVRWVARPGFSAHQSGRAVDLYLGPANDSRNVARLRNTAAYQWMVKNARRFGFYPYEREPWHWEYNPPAGGGSEFELETGEAFEAGSALDVLSPSELKAVRITSTFETGRAGGFGGLTGNFDGQGLSFGLMNFTVRAGSLIPLLQEFINRFPARFAAAFGKDAARFREIVFAVKPDPKNPKKKIRDVERQMQFVNTQMNLIPRKARGNRIVEPWKTYFGRLENDPEFRKIQVKAVRRALAAARRWCARFGLKTERGFVFMFDLVSSHGGAWLDAPKFKGRRIALLEKMSAAKKAARGTENLSELDKMEVIANMIADASLPEWREKARTRKLWFVRGAGKVHGTFYDLRKNFGVTDDPPNFNGASAKELADEWFENGEYEFEQKAAAAPPLARKPEKAAQGETFYVKIPIGLGKNIAVTGIYIPDTFKPDTELELVVYLHGHKSAYPGSSVLIDGYWNAARFPFFGLREEVAASGRNVVLVAPSLGARSEAGGLIRKGGFDAYLGQVLAALNEHYFMPRHRRRVSEVGGIYLAAHSGGGKPMQYLAGGTDRAAAKVRECWCYDSMYGAVAPFWVKWAKSNPSKNLYVYYGPAKGWVDKNGEKHTTPRDNAEAIACEKFRLGLSNVCVEPSRAKTVGKAHAHFWVPKVHFRERLMRGACSTHNVCPRRSPVGKKAAPGIPRK